MAASSGDKAPEHLDGGASLERLLPALIEAFEVARPGAVCSVMLLDRDGKRLRLSAGPSLPKFYRDAVDGIEIGEGVGSCGTAAYRGERVIVEDIWTHPYWTKYREITERAGLRACWSEPIASPAGEVLGTFAVYYRQVRGPDRADLNLIESYARLVRIAIANERGAAALLDSEKRFRDFAGVSSDWFWETGPDQRFTWFSDGHRERIGAVADSFLGKTRWEISDDEDQDEKWAAHRLLLEAHRPFRNFCYSVRDGERHLGYRCVSGIPLFDSDGRFQGYRGTGREIDSQSLADHAFAENEAHLRQVETIARIGFFVWDTLEDRCTYCSQGLADLYGLSVADALEEMATYERVLDFLHPEDRARYHDVVEAAGDAKAPYRVDYRIVDESGGVRHWREIGEPVFDEEGRFVRTVGTIQDVTESKTAEDRLRHAQKLQAIGQLTGGVAHDFNNLLSVINCNAQLLRDELGDPARLLQEVMEATARGAALIRKLLAFSRQQPLRTRAVDLGTLAGGLTQVLERTLGETIEVEFLIPSGLWTAAADSGQVENALLNLAINARDAMPDGGKLIVKMCNAPLDKADAGRPDDVAPKDYVVIEVTDSGCGMPPEVARQAVEPFFTTKEAGLGSGLGLSMVYGFAKQSGGHVMIESEPGRGTTVRLYLPRTEEVCMPAEAPVERDAPRGHGETVLVVEDDAKVRQLAATLLDTLGYHTLDAADGLAALRILEGTRQIDLILTDAVLPGGLSGPQLIEEAKRRGQSFKALVMSGYSPEVVARQGVAAADLDLLDKPFQVDDLARKVRAALDRRAA
jgi:PAS domain S-box-containing protein